MLQYTAEAGAGGGMEGFGMDQSQLLQMMGLQMGGAGMKLH